MKVYDNISLKEYNTFGIDVQARRLMVLEPDDANNIPNIGGDLLIIGSGSDLVFTQDYEGTVLMLDRTEMVSVDGHCVTAWGGMCMDHLVEWTLEHGLYGLENLSAIPGTVGASVVQNVGAYGVEVKDVVERVDLYDLKEREYTTYRPEQCRFAYRSSVFKQEQGRYLVLRVVFRLSDTFSPNLKYKALEGLPHATAQQLRQAIEDLRWQKLPRPEEHGSAGSFFKNPVVDDATFERLRSLYPDMPVYAGNKLSAGWLIDRCGWKGKTLGRVGVWPKQALVLYNAGGCSGDEVVHLAQNIKKDVFNQFGVSLEPEAIII